MTVSVLYSPTLPSVDWADIPVSFIPLSFDFLAHFEILSKHVLSRRLELDVVRFWLEDFAGAGVLADRLVGIKIKHICALSVRALLGKKPKLELPSDVGSDRCADLVAVHRLCELWGEIGAGVGLKLFVLESTPKAIGKMTFEKLDSERIKFLMTEWADDGDEGDREFRLNVGQCVSEYVSYAFSCPAYTRGDKNKLKSLFLKSAPLVDGLLVQKILLECEDLEIGLEGIDCARQVLRTCSDDEIEGLVNVTEILINYFHLSISIAYLRTVPLLSEERRVLFFHRVVTKRLLGEMDGPWYEQLAGNMARVFSGMKIDWESLLFEKLIYCSGPRIILREIGKYVDPGVVKRVAREGLRNGNMPPQEWMSKLNQIVPKNLMESENRLVKKHSLVTQLMMSETTQIQTKMGVIANFIPTRKTTNRKLELLISAKTNAHAIKLNCLTSLENMGPLEVFENIFFFNPLSFLDTSSVQNLMAELSITPTSPEYPFILHCAAIAYIMTGELDGAISITQRLINDHSYSDAWRLAVVLKQSQLVLDTIKLCEENELAGILETLAETAIETDISDQQHTNPINNALSYISKFPNLNDQHAVNEYIASIGSESAQVSFETAELLSRMDFKNINALKPIVAGILKRPVFSH